MNLKSLLDKAQQQITQLSAENKSIKEALEESSNAGHSASQCITTDLSADPTNVHTAGTVSVKSALKHWLRQNYNMLWLINLMLLIIYYLCGHVWIMEFVWNGEVQYFNQLTWCDALVIPIYLLSWYMLTKYKQTWVKILGGIVIVLFAYYLFTEIWHFEDTNHF